MADDGVARGRPRRRADHPAHEEPAPHDLTHPHHPRPGRRPDRGRRRRDRPRHHRRRRRPRRGHPRPVGAGRRRPRPRVRHVALVLQARARRPALPRHRPGRRRPRERRRARHPHGRHRAAPHPRAADARAVQLQRLRRAGRRHPRRRCSPATCCAAVPAPAPDTLPKPRHLSATEALALAPSLRPAGLRGAMLGWDGQLEDDARLVTTVARTAASYGAHVRTRARVALRDRHLGAAARRAHRRASSTCRARGRSSTPPACGPATSSRRSTCGPAAAPTWCCASPRVPGLQVAVFAPVPGETNRFVLVLPQPDGTLYVGLTDEPADGPIPDVPEPTEPEIGFLLDVVAAAFAQPLHRSDVVGAFAGLRPLLDVPDSKDGHGSTRPPTSPAGTRSSRRAPAWSPSWAASSRRTAGWPRTPSTPRSPAPASTPARAGPATLPLLGAAARDVLAGLEQHRPAGAAVRHRRRAGAGLGRRGDRPGRGRAARPGRRRTSRSPWPSWSSAVTHEGAARRRRPARPAYPRRPGPRRPRARRARRRAGAGAGRRAAPMSSALDPGR